MFLSPVFAGGLSGQTHPLVSAMGEDSLRISLLTCSPGQKVYELYGHTAIRVQILSSEDDWVFNYGVFSFNRPNFVWRFVKGETDYQLGVLPFPLFLREYRARGSYVVEQELNLRSEEKQRLFYLLLENLRPENIEYRYNFLYNNCTTRARDVIAECLEEEIHYPEMAQKSFRNIIHEYTTPCPWSELGQDVLLGGEADAPQDGLRQMFAPFYYSRALDSTYVGSPAARRPLVSGKRLVLPAVNNDAPEASPRGPLSPPFFVTAVGLLLTLGVGWLERKRKKLYWGYDICLFGIQGLIGCVVAGLFFASEHPAVGSNWLIIIFNPLTLCYLPFMVYRSIHRKKDAYHAVAAAVLMIFIVSIPLIPQKIPSAIVVLALNLWLRSADKLYTYYNRTDKVYKKCDPHA